MLWAHTGLAILLCHVNLMSGSRLSLRSENTMTGKFPEVIQPRPTPELSKNELEK